MENSSEFVVLIIFSKFEYEIELGPKNTGRLYKKSG